MRFGAGVSGTLILLSGTQSFHVFYYWTYEVVQGTLKGIFYEKRREREKKKDNDRWIYVYNEK